MSRFWFSPGPVPVSETISIEFSHRSEKFAQIYVDTIKQIKAITGGREAVLIQGSASAAIESVLYATGFIAGQDVWVLDNGSFSTRVLERLNENSVNKKRQFNTVEYLEESLGDLYYHPDGVYAVQFETSCSKYNDLTKVATICKERKIKLVVDAVSAFPFYPLPDADVVILSSSKQLRGLPVLGIVSYNENRLDHSFYDCGPEYLSLNYAIEKGKTGQTPHTSMMPQVLSLWRSLVTRDYVKPVDAIVGNCFALTQGLNRYILGEIEAPVITFKCDSALLGNVVDELEKEGFDVYCNRSYMLDKFQVSCFNYDSQHPYKQLNEAIKKLIEKGWM